MHWYFCILAWLCAMQVVAADANNSSDVNSIGCTATISCCDVYESFNKFIPSLTGDESKCSAENDCESTRLRFLVNRLNQLHGKAVDMNSTDVIVDLTNQTLLADLLVSRILAQYLSHEGYQDDFSIHFLFDETAQNLKEVFGACVFEKELYVALLVISVGLLILCLLLQLHAAETKSKLEPVPVNGNASYTLMTVKPTNMRYRLGRSN